MRSELGYKNIYTSLKISISNLYVVRGNQPSPALPGHTGNVKVRKVKLRV